MRTAHFAHTLSALAFALTVITIGAPIHALQKDTAKNLPKTVLRLDFKALEEEKKILTPANRPPPTLDRSLPGHTWKSAGNTAYYVDSHRGSDTASGRSPAAAWKGLGRVNAGLFAPGDRILLRAGSQWNGQLAPGGAGDADRPIVIDRFGTGPKPALDGQGKFQATVTLANVQYYELRRLDIANHGQVPQPHLVGVEVSLSDYGEAHGIRLEDLDIHDVTGSLVKDEGGGSGIDCTNGGSKIKSRFDGLTIEGCHLKHCDRNGVIMGGYWSRTDWFPSLHVVIRKNLLEDIGGDGIVPFGCDGALVERNVLHGGRQRCGDYAAGIWPWSCDNTTIQYNEVSGMKGTLDGEGYDSDYNCRNTLFQYNYSHDNDGGFMLICNDGAQKMPSSVGNIGTIVRYNISQNDGLHTFNIAGPCRNTAIYNNVFYVGKALTVQIIASGNWGGDWSEDTRFTNNIFVVDGKATFDLGGCRKTVFENNIYHGNIIGRPFDPNALDGDPMLDAPGSGTNGLETLHGYRVQVGSPCVGAAKPIEQNGKRDFWGNSIPVDGPATIGAEEKL